MIKVIKRHKILIMLCVFALMLLGCNSSFGFDFIGSDGQAYQILDLPSDVKGEFIIFKQYNSFYLAYPEGVPEEEYSNLIFRQYGHKIGFATYLDQLEGHEKYCSCYRYDFTSSSPSWEKWVTKIPDINGKNDYVIYSTRDILAMDTGEVFFQKPPQTVMTGITSVEEIPELVKKILIILLPVGLTIFGVLLVVSLIRSKKWLKM